MVLKTSHIIVFSTVTLFLLFSNTFVYTALNNGISIAGSDSLNDVQLYPPNTNTSAAQAVGITYDIRGELLDIIIIYNEF